jgi:hypothetical protein
MSFSFSLLESNDSHEEGWEVDRFSSIPDDVLCPLCAHVCREAMALNCGHAFCKNCILASKEHLANTCPECNGFVTQLVPDFAKRMKINGLILSCTYKKEGCMSKEAVSRIIPHEYMCEYEPVSCVLCQHKVCRHALHNHTEVCAYRPFTCETCTASIPYCTKEDHLLHICPAVETDCLYCSWTGTRGTLPQHELLCPLKPIPCIYTQYGCSELVPRCNMTLHSKETSHIPLLYQAIHERDQKWMLVRPDGPFHVSSHKHPVILCADLTDPCSWCKKELVKECERTFAYRCTQGCEYQLCTSCLITQRTYKVKSNVTVPNYFFSFLHP